MASNKGGDPFAGLFKQLQTVKDAPPVTTHPFEDELFALKARVAATPKPKEDTFSIGDVFSPIKSTLQAPIIAANKILEVASVPRRFVTSVVRETVDVLDSDPNTKASVNDLFDQTNDKNFGYGKAFPMKGWAGRIVGLVGDMALDPINWFTLGGYVSKTATFTSKGGTAVESRLLLGKTTLGRDAREKLAQAARDRMIFHNEKAIAEGGSELFSRKFISDTYARIGEEGKRALPKLIRNDLGVKESGLYFLGRTKVPGTGPIAAALEKGIVETRLGVMNTRPAKWVMDRMTPTGVGRIAEYGEDTVRNMRTAIARGTLEPHDVELAMTVLSSDFAKRTMTAKAINDAEGKNLLLVNDPMHAQMEDRIHLLLDYVDDPRSVPGFTEQEYAYAVLVRKQYDELRDHVVRVFQVIDPSYEVGDIKGFFPHVTTDKFQKLSAQIHAGTAAVGEGVDSTVQAGETVLTHLGEPIDAKLLNEWMAGTYEYELTDSARLGTHFRAREVTYGKTWFGVKLERETVGPLTADNLNRIALESGKVDFNIFETGGTKTMARYIQSYADQIGLAAMVDDVMRKSPELLSKMEKVPGLNPASVKNIVSHTPRGAVNDAFNSLQALSRVSGKFADAINAALKEIHTDPAMARLLILSDKVDSKKLNTLRAAIDAASENARLVGEATSKHYGKLRDEFDAVAAVTIQHNPQYLDDIEKEMKGFQKALRQTGTAPVVASPAGKNIFEIGRAQRRSVNDFVAGKGTDVTFYDSVNQGLENGLRLLKILKRKDPALLTTMDNMLLAQVVAESRFWAAASRMKAADIESQYMRQLQAMLKTGDAAIEAGQDGLRAVNAATGEILTGIPATALIMKNQLREGMVALSKEFPGLQATPQFASLWGNISRFQDPAWLNEYAKTAVALTKIHKAYAVLTPGFQIRNFMANIATWATHGVSLKSVHLVTPYYIAWKRAWLAGVPWEKFLETVPDDMRVVLTNSRLATFGSGGGIYSGIMKDAQGVSKLINNRVVKANLNLGQESDDYFRFVMAFDSTIRGLDVGQASARIANSYFDYEDLSKFDRGIKNVVPFWIWTSRNLQSHLSNMIFNPRPYLRYEAFKRNMQAYQLTDESYVPPTVVEQGGFKLPFGQNLFAVPDLGFTRVSQQLDQIAHPQKYVSQLNPLIRVPLEQVFGQSFYSGKELDTASARIGHVAKGLVVTANMLDNLFLTDDQKQKNAWLSFLGSPVRQYGPPTK